MYVVSKRMKKKNNIDDERQAVYQAISMWLAEIGERKFLGGKHSDVGGKGRMRICDDG